MEVRIGQVAAAETYELRHRVLRPHQTLDEMAFPGDRDPGTVTLAARADTSTAIIGAATLVREPPPWSSAGRPGLDPVGPDALPDLPARAREAAAAGRPAAWRLRAMATASDLRGQGVGRRVLDAALDHVATHGGGLLWCAARVRAVPFYERAGLACIGPSFEEPSIGPHVLMWTVVDGRSGSPVS